MSEFVGSPRYTEMVRRAMKRPRSEGEIGVRIVLQFAEETAARLDEIGERLDLIEAQTR